MSLSRRMLGAVALLSASLIVTGCSLTPPIAPHPALDRAERAATLTRRLTFEPGDETTASDASPRTLIAVMRLAPQELRVVLTTPYGQRLTTLVRDASGSRFEQGDAPREEALPFPPDWLATRLEWSLWPRAALEEAFAGSDWRLDERDGHRLITYRGTRIARITPPPSGRDASREVVLDDFQGDYRLRITPLDATPDHETVP
ncbi:DUF3261 domain-containing protein [Chromohalobacter israelensis]|uniref:DUF3261 domain-containing protein n=1 Tax=Chromohalobacter israelensis TaxID=141390 RepID=UPI003AF60F13